MPDVTETMTGCESDGMCHTCILRYVRPVTAGWRGDPQVT